MRAPVRDVQMSRRDRESTHPKHIPSRVGGQARLAAREQDVEQIQEETEKTSSDAHQVIDELRRQLNVARANAEDQAKQYFEEIHKLTEK